MVNPAITAALIAASHEEGEESVEAKLKKAGALSPTSAIALELEGQQQEQLDQSLANGTVRRTSDGWHYLNELAVANRAEGQGFMALLILLVVASVFASAAVLVVKAGG